LLAAREPVRDAGCTAGDHRHAKAEIAANWASAAPFQELNARNRRDYIGRRTTLRSSIKLKLNTFKTIPFTAGQFAQANART